MFAVHIRWVLGATLTMAAALGIARFAYTPLLPDMVQTLGWTFAQAGDVASANFLGYLVGALLAPRFAHHTQIRLILAVSLMSIVGTTYLGAHTETFVAWLTLRFCAGAASAFCLVIATTHLLMVLQQSQKEHLGNLHFAGVGIGIVTCMWVLGDIVSVTSSWQNLGAASAFLMAIAWFLLQQGPFLVPAQSATGTTTESRKLWRVTIGYGLFGYGYVVSATFVVAMGEQLNNQVHSASSISVWMVVGLSIIPSVYLWQWLANRWQLSKTLKLAYLVEAIGAVLAGLSTTQLELVIACVLLGGTFAAITALGISAAKSHTPGNIAFAVSGMTVAFSLGQLIGPAVSGRLADVFGDFVWASLIAGLLLVIAALLVPTRAND